MFIYLIKLNITTIYQAFLKFSYYYLLESISNNLSIVDRYCRDTLLYFKQVILFEELLQLVRFTKVKE